MNFKKISISILLICIIALSISSVQAGNETNVVQSTDTPALTAEIPVDGTGTDAITDAIKTAKDGDTVNLGTNKEYNINNDSISIDKKITLKGNNVSITAGSLNGGLSIQGNDITIQGIKFINPIELPDYGGKLTGTAIYARATDNLVIDNCQFINYEYGINMYTSTGATIKNCWFNGATTSVSGMAGTGTKAIQLMSSHNADIINNTFYGQIYDGLSIASGSGYVNIENNTFINNTFAIFYGGSSTEGGKIKNNKFITCGFINTTWYSSNIGQTFSITLEDLPYIGLQKASSDIDIIENEFVVKNKSRIIYAEPGNEEHGFPSPIGAINIQDNKITKENPSADYESVIFMHIHVVSTLSLNPTEDIVIKNNDFTEVPEIEKLRLDFDVIKEDDAGDITIPKLKSANHLSVVYVKDGRVVVEMQDMTGNPVSGEKINYYINGGARQTATTDEYGHIYINGLSGEAELEIIHPESDSYTRSSLETTIQVSPEQTPTQISAGKLSVSAASAKNTIYKITLKDNTGKILAGKSISVTFNGKVYTVNTDKNGVAGFSIPVSAAGNYAVTMAFTGDSGYKGSVATSTISIIKQATTLKIAKKTFKKSATKKITATLKAGGKTIKGKKVTFKVNGKTYSAKTNAKGVQLMKVVQV